VKRLLLAASGAAAALAAASTFVLAGPAHAAVGEIAVIQSNGTVLSSWSEHVDNVTNPIEIVVPEAFGATEATIENLTDQPIRATINGATTVVIDPLQKATLPETGIGDISILVPAGN
jgi:hypothetical protein